MAHGTNGLIQEEKKRKKITADAALLEERGGVQEYCSPLMKGKSLITFDSFFITCCIIYLKEEGYHKCKGWMWRKESEIIWNIRGWY